MKPQTMIFLIAGMAFLFPSECCAQQQLKPIFKHSTPGQFMAVAFSPDARMIVSGGSRKDLTLWEIASGKPRLVMNGHTERIRCVAYSPDGKIIASGSWDNTIRLWRASTGEELAILRNDDRVSSVAFNPSGTMLASGNVDGTVKIWEIATMKSIATMIRVGVKARGVNSVEFSRDGKTLVSGGHSKIVQLWDAASGKEKSSLREHPDQIHSVAFHPDGKSVASAADLVRLWDINTGNELAKQPTEPRPAFLGKADGFLSLAFSPNGNLLAFADLGLKTVNIWDGKLSKSLLVLNWDPFIVHCLTFDSSGEFLAAAGGDTFAVWRLPEILQTKGE